MIVRVGGERLARLGRNRRVALDERRHDAASRLDAERKRRNVEQEKILHVLRLVAAEDGRLNCGAVRDRLVRIDALVELLAAEEVAEQLLHFRDTSRAADEDDVVDLRFVHLGIAERLFHRIHGAAEKIGAKLFEASSRDVRVEVGAFVQRIDLNAENICVVQ